MNFTPFSPVIPHHKNPIHLTYENWQHVITSPTPSPPHHAIVWLIAHFLFQIYHSEDFQMYSYTGFHLLPKVGSYGKVGLCY